RQPPKWPFVAQLTVSLLQHGAGKTCGTQHCAPLLMDGQQRSALDITCSRCGRVFHPALPSLQDPFVLGIVRTSRRLAHSTNSVLSRSISGGCLHSRNFHQRSREHEYASCSYPLV